jgi:DNA-directed RNA polymerase specialized sigma24 family protein
MESRFATTDGLAYMDSIFTEPTDEDLQQIGQIREVLELLPAREADFVDLYYFRQLRQTDIAAIFGVSQPTVCYRLARAADRIKFLLHLPDICRKKLTADLSGFLSDPLDVQVMVLMWETTCQSEVAKRLGVSQGLVRHRFLRSLERMRSNRKFSKYISLFKYIAENLNILREVQRPSWSGRITHSIL